ncbi:alkaline phosphatase family protein [Fulvivirga sp. RKSG066]|uniref:alkaline phosphatase PafA n=1 Tax=Fulvivirga aurantia TaxID=2529383 RepID=UPI0012BC16E8|nr:alkaline phosphatase PafA [Fulvivirga aurantia]MTI21318.1 alkaline phosphatase family protein [Fulvivirga aurantia]
MKRILFLPLLFTILSVSAQQKPKLIVGIIVDQMRQEYLYRFNEKFSDHGFKKLINEGYMYKNAHFNYVPTYTAPGHASVYTGTTPAIHGVIGNSWYDKESKQNIYCAHDESESTVGSNSDNGHMSPRNLLTTTIGDELRFSTQMRSKVIGLSIKDRGAIFPAGHTGEAFWYDKDTGDFISSTYYSEQLPEWVKEFNNQNKAENYLTQTWEPSANLDTYIESINDENEYEDGVGKDKATFPYPMKKDGYWMVPATPFGNEILTDISLAAIKNTSLGEDDITDLLAISFSSTDYVGHGFGPNSKEVEDTYIKLDKNIATIIETLDDEVGKGNYLIFLTADHAVAEVPQLLIDSKVPAGYFDKKQLDKLNEAIEAKYGKGDWIENVSNNQIFLNRKTIASNNQNLIEIQNFVADHLLLAKGVARSYPAHLINSIDYDAGGVKGLMARGYNQKRSGDVIVELEPGWMIRSSKGSTHGSAYTYDTHVPMIWYGAGVPVGESVNYHPITDIAPTLSMLLDIKLPNGATGQPLTELLK